MGSLLPQLMAFPPHPPPSEPLSDAEYDKQIKDLVQLLNQTSASKLVGDSLGEDDLLNILNPSINTLPYLHALLAHIDRSYNGKQSTALSSKPFSPNGDLWFKALEFIERFDPVQVRYAGPEFRRLLEAVARAAGSSSQRSVAVIPIRTAMLRLDPTSSCLTSTHLVFVHLCLQERCFRDALPILDNDVFHFPTMYDKNSNQPLLCAQHETSSTYITNTSGISEKLYCNHHLQYFLYGAMLYIGVKDWNRALLFLEIVLRSPTSGNASMIQVEAYKKFVLVGLLLGGRPLAMPRTSNAQAKSYRAIGRAYDTIAEAFKDGNNQRLYDEVQAGQALWQEDRNAGLVHQVLNAHRRFSVLKLEKTYAALSVSQVAQRTFPRPANDGEMESYLASLIISGQLHATLKSVPTGSSILRFSTSSTAGGLQIRSEEQQYRDLILQTSKTVKLANHIKQTDRRLELSKEYLDWSKKMRKAKSPGEAVGDANPTTTQIGQPDDYGIDEDMMADL